MSWVDGVWERLHLNEACPPVCNFSDLIMGELALIFLAGGLFEHRIAAWIKRRMEADDELEEAPT